MSKTTLQKNQLYLMLMKVRLLSPRQMKRFPKIQKIVLLCLQVP